MAGTFLSMLLPFLSTVVAAVGIVLTARGRGTHGRAAVIGMLGCVALLLNGLLQILQAILLNVVIESVGLAAMGIVIMVLNLLYFLLTTTGVALLIWAVVARRAPQPQPGPQQPGWHQQPPAPYQHPQQGWQQPPSYPSR
ncbi:hypothetical protein AB0J42_17470 [Nonomuraea sp. NPDC049649]|uniref:hypothetical protein n=1 Tax=Nonomuraea sp. NPDC049649 TaxID=3155776 RepID=UPI003414AC6A